VPVFNAPGANANAVKELVLAGMLLAARNLPPALDFVRGLKTSSEFEEAVEDGTKQFCPAPSCRDIRWGIIGLGKIGSLVADAAIRLGMNVLGYDPHITVDAAWSLPSQVRKAASVDDLLKQSHFVSLHVPLGEKTRHLIDARNIDHFRAGAVLLNFSREGVVADDAVVRGLNGHRLKWYVTDFRAPSCSGHAGSSRCRISAPRRASRGQQRTSWWSTSCATTSSTATCRTRVEFPDAAMAREAPYRLAIATPTFPTCWGHLARRSGGADQHPHMLNKSKGEMATRW